MTLRWRAVALASAAALPLAVLGAGAGAGTGDDASVGTSAGDRAGDNPAVWRLSLRSERHNDALPLSVPGDDTWRRLLPCSGRNLAYQDDEVRLSRSAGQAPGQWIWALLARNHATLVASQQALALAARVANSRRPAADAQWQAGVRLRAFAGAGIAIGRTQPLAPGWSAHWEAQTLALSRWRARDLGGAVQYGAASRQYSFDLQSQEIDNRLATPFRQDFAARGVGLLLAGGLDWAGSSTWARVALRDGGWLRWRGVPQQRASLNTATEAVDADGFLLYKPLVTGRNSQSGAQRWLPWRSQVAAGLALADGQRWGLQIDALPGFGALPALLWQRPAPAPDGLALGAEWQVHERRLTLSSAWQGLSLRIGADRLGSAARSRVLVLGYGRAF